jgi:mannose-1-phosphate guanylyltransferase
LVGRNVLSGENAVIGFILAAGFGTRLKPLSDHVPKALVPVCGIPLLQRAQDFLRANGLSRFAVNSHHHPELVDLFIKNNFPRTRIFQEQPEIRGTGGALYFAKDFLASDDAFCVINVDIITNADLRKLGVEFMRRQCDVGLVVAPAENGTIQYHTATGNFAATRSRQDRDAQKPVIAPYSCADFIGITFYRKDFLSLLNGDDFDIIPVWARAQERGMKVTVLETGAVYWKDVGTPKNLAKVHFDVLDGTFALPVSASMIVDNEAKKAFPRSCDDSFLKRLGPYSWVEADSVPEETAVAGAVVFRDANVPAGVQIQNAIVTKYGVIPFDP